MNGRDWGAIGAGMNRRFFLGSVISATAGAVTIATDAEVAKFTKVDLTKHVDPLPSGYGEPVFRQDGQLLGFITSTDMNPIDITTAGDSYARFMSGQITYTVTVAGRMR